MLHPYERFFTKLISEFCEKQFIGRKCPFLLKNPTKKNSISVTIKAVFLESILWLTCPSNWDCVT
jgi:hypothetical protein